MVCEQRAMMLPELLTRELPFIVASEQRTRKEYQWYHGTTFTHRSLTVWFAERSTME